MGCDSSCSFVCDADEWGGEKRERLNNGFNLGAFARTFVGG